MEALPEMEAISFSVSELAEIGVTLAASRTHWATLEKKLSMSAKTITERELRRVGKMVWENKIMKGDHYSCSSCHALLTMKFRVRGLVFLIYWTCYKIVSKQIWSPL